ncbi:hypothetical protein QZH41_017128 [Actinostola sp. cb2023]|nr:hypothetical protein QZH41_017128 [Actinostola sp. cb2023]
MKGYLEFDSFPKGTMRILVSDHHDDPDADMVTPNHIPSYCCNIQDENSKPRELSCIACESIDAQELSWPVESRVLSLMTFCKDRWQVKHKNGTLPQQNYVNIRERKYHTLNPENVMLKIEHSIIATRFSNGAGHDGLAASQRTLKGFLYDINGNAIKSMSTNDITNQKGQADKLTVHELLNAAGVRSLDEASDAINAKGKSYRRHGLVLQVVVRYHNAENTWLGTGGIEYCYHVRRVPYADYRINQVIPVISTQDFIASNGTTNGQGNTTIEEARLFRKRYGIKMEFYQSGKLGRFSLSALLIKLVAGVGLLTLTATVVDLGALYVLPDRYRYRRCVYEESPVILPADKKTD